MLVAGQKRKHVHKTLREKAQALKDIENDHRTKRLQVNKKYHIYMAQKQRQNLVITRRRTKCKTTKASWCSS